jgi:DNA topoisomerase-3
VSRDALRARLAVADEELDRALEKLWIHGGVEVGADDELRCGKPGWQTSYVAQRQRKAEHLAEMAHLAEGHDCRMLHLVRHFGDREDSGSACGLCDACAPSGCVAARFRPPMADEQERLDRIVRALQFADRQPTGQLCKQVMGDDRREFERLLRGLARAGLVRLTQESFEKEGRRIEYQRATLTFAGGGGGARVFLEEDPRRRRRSGGEPETRRRRQRGSNRSAGPIAASRGEARPARLVAAAASPELVEQLRAWRLSEARRRKVPAFCVLTNRTLLALAEERPGNEQALLAIPGIGPAVMRTYGQKLLELCARA